MLQGFTGSVRPGVLKHLEGKVSKLYYLYAGVGALRCRAAKGAF